MKLNDLNEASLAGALMSKLGAKLRGGPEDQMSTADRMAQQQFTQDLIGQLATSLAQGINGGIVNPDPKAGMGDAPAAAPTAPAAPAAPVQQTPAQIRQQKQATAAQQAQSQMTPAPAKPVAAPSPVAAPVAKGSKQLGPKGRATLARIGKQKQDRENSGQQSLDLNESKFSKLNQIFESVIALNEADYPYTISSYVQNFVKKFLGTSDVSALKSVADQIQQTYAQDKGQKALTKLASAAYSLYHAGGQASGSQSIPAGTSQVPASVSAAPAAPATAPAVSPQKVQSVYKQVKGLMGQLNKQQKGYILKSLEKEVGKPMNAAPNNQQPATPEPTPAPAAPSAKPNFGQQTNYSKTTMNAPTGVPNPVVASNRAAKVNAKMKPAASKIQEHKGFKLWGNSNESK